ncbi:MAG TPA: ABC transporter permease [Candidatus Dormibacteraeota bacterium]|jgi:simple sugar transport system permease protein|nr:ABC transporter permease [Candidatus Dormibacteraeota bacterium]
MTDFLSRLDVVGFIIATLVAATPLVLAGMGGVMSERSGVVNIALEGIMLTSAFAGYAAAVATHNLWLGVLVSIVAGMLIAALHAVLSIHFLVDQIVSGTVINILAIGITGSFYRTYIQNSELAGTGVLPALQLNFLPNSPIIGVITIGALLLIPVVHYVLFNTVFGLRTRACGEHPLAAETAGINVYLVRYSNVILSGALAGLGGAYFTLQQIGNFLPNMTGGRGFIALAAMIFGRWTPAGAFLASLLFASADALSGRLQIAGVALPYQILGMLPYVLTIVVVAGVWGRAVAPAADGKPYKKGG